MDKPDFPMYAVLKENVVIDCGFGNTETVYSANTAMKEPYQKSDGFYFVEMTLENSPASFGMTYDGSKFYFKGENNE
jgi:hypothetical protein